MRVRDLLPFIDKNQEVVIRAGEGGNTLSGTAYTINVNQEKCKEFLDRNIVCIYNHCWKMYIIIELHKEMEFNESK